ncbi:related to hexose transporter protein [Phialocephala subalpina]|uniref:Related to hexose transporter protein n=1 Tax=Phialocephala subalpina TaxID=576137 RepID=A0A1L7X757_9HELO|nr:related to hexose transporter protein [Phialocephala subalpina]
MVGYAVGTQASKAAELEVAQAEAPEFEQVTWYTDPGLRKLYFWCSILCVASATTGYDGKQGLLNAIYQIGSLVSFPLVPYMADWWGRKVPILCGGILIIIGGFLGAFSNGYGMYLGGRFILGFGNSLSQMSSPVLLTELCHSQHRGRFTAIYNCLWNLGAVCNRCMACMGNNADPKRLGLENAHSFPSTPSFDCNQAFSLSRLSNFAILGAPEVVSSSSALTFCRKHSTNFLKQVAFIYWVPESPRWLISKERYEEAETTLARYRLAILISLGIISQYSGNALFSNYMNLIYKSAGITAQNQTIPLNGGQNILSLLVSVGCAFLVDRVGRRPLFLASTSGMVLMFVAWTIVSSQYHSAL